MVSSAGCGRRPALPRRKGSSAPVPDLSFRVAGAEVVPYSATPMLSFHLEIANADPAEVIHAVALRCQIQIEAPRRRYSAEEGARLRDLFGDPGDWSRTLRGLLWTFTSVNVPAFIGGVTAGLPVPCTYDLNVIAAKYFYALEDGHVPLSLLFSGTVFYKSDGAGLQVAQIPWEKEAAFQLPVRTWRDMMDHYYPNTAWLCLHRDAFDRLYRYKQAQGLPTWEAVVERLLPANGHGKRV
jgi:hypothetical protein